MIRRCFAPVTGLCFCVLLLASACGTTTGGTGGGFLNPDTTGKDLGVASDTTATTGDTVTSKDGVLTDGAVTDGVATDTTTGETVIGDVITDAEQDLGPVDGGCGAKPCCAAVSDCDDSDLCTTDSCNAGYCIHTPIAGCGNASPPCSATTPCAFGVCDTATNACVSCLTTSDCPGGAALCIDQKCVPATACKSDVTCKPLSKVCDKTVGVCVDCIQNGDCGADAACVQHTCHPSKTCTSSKDCPSVCDLTSGTCVECLSADDCPNEKFCNATHQCQADVCAAGGCQPGAYFSCKSDGSGYSAPVKCEDGNPCTDNNCDGQKGCVVVNNTVKCDDGSACTQNDTCASSTCKGTILNCDDKNPCTTDSCNPSLGCAHVANTGTCDDGNACTQNDVCSGSTCKGAVISCDDFNPCTDDTCDAQTGCAHANNTAPCNDASACTTGDTCNAGICKGTAKVCDDNNSCTANQCLSASGCSYPATSGSCDDGDACTIGDACYLGYCNSGTAKNCTDSNPCTDDTCFGGTCNHANNATACEDGDACTLYDACGSGKCVSGSTAKVCDDSNPCTNDSCVPAAGCSFKSNALSCDDGNACTTADTCQGGSCVGGAAKVCNDSDGCTLDSCSATTGCVFAADKVKCDDKDVCTLDTCVGPAGTCTHTAIGNCCKDQATCNDGNACTTDVCAGNSCYHQTDANCCAADTDCSDSNQCTTDSCVSGKCGHLALVGTPTPTWTVGWDTIGGNDGFAGDTVPGGFQWGEQVTLPHDGTGSFALTATGGGAFTGVKTTVVSTAVGPVVQVPAGGTYAFSLWYRLDLTAGSGTVTINALLGNAALGSSVVQLATSPTLNNWQQLKIDATALAGQKFLLQFKVQVNGTTSTPAAGKGAFFDTVSLAGACPSKTCTVNTDCASSVSGCFVAACNAGTCGYSRTCCTAATDCDDGNSCTTDACGVAGSCTHTAIANCCASSGGCDDKNACTLDVCTNGACSHPAIAGCCLTASDCNDADACTNDVCAADHSCKHPALCCKVDKDCNDGDDKCTTDTCIGNVCQYKTNSAVAGCCDPNVYAESFDATLSGWTFTNSTGIPTQGWQEWLGATYTVSPTGVLYYGDPAVKSYAFSGANSGTADSPKFTIPLGATSASLSIQLYYVTETGSSYDNFDISVVGTTTTQIWSKGTALPTTSTWVPIKLDLTPYAGQTISLHFSFATEDGVSNSTIGALFDDLKVTRSCP